jgi:WD40 repeat protein
LPARADEPEALPPGAVLRLGSVRWRAGASIALTAFRNGGRELLTVGADRMAIVWDVESGRELRRFDVGGPPLPPQASPQSPDNGRVTVSADGRVLAAICRDRKLRLFDVDRGKETILVDSVLSNNLPALSADGKLLALYQQPEFIKVWDFSKEGKPPETLYDLAPAHGGTNYVYRLEFGADGKTLTQVGMQYRPNGGVAPHIVLWDVVKGTRIKQHDELPQGAARDAVLHAFPGRDGKSLIIPMESSIAVMDLETGKEVRRLRDAEEVAASSFLTTADGKDLIQVVGRGEAIVVWDLAKGTAARRVGKPDENTSSRPILTNLSLSLNGQTLAFGDGALVSLVDLRSGKKRGENEGHSTGLLGAAYAPDGKTILTRADRTYIRWDAASGRFLERWDVVAPLRAFLLSRDAKWMVAPGPNMTLHILDAATKQEKQAITTELPYYTYSIMADSRTLLALGRPAPHLLVFDIVTGAKLADFPLPRSDAADDEPFDLPPRRLSTTPDARLIACNTERAILVFDLVWRREVLRVDLPAGKMVRCLSFAPDGRSLAVEFYGGEIGLWEVAAGMRRRLIAKGSASPAIGTQAERMRIDGSRVPSAISFSDDGRLVAAAGTDRVVRLFDARTAREAGALGGHRGLITAVNFSPDGARLITACADTTALVWDLAPLRAKLDPAPPAVHDAPWEALGEADAEKAYDAILALAADPGRCVAFARERLAPVAPPDEKMMAKLIAGLDSAKYAERQAARKELEKLGDLALPALKRAQEANTSAEVQATARRLIESLATRRLSATEVRQVRAVEALELAGNVEVKEVLKSLAAGAPAAPQTIDAKLALERLNERR